MVKKITKGMLLFGVLSVMLSCSKDDENTTNANCIAEVTKQTDVVSGKQIKYAGSPTAQNCKEYQTALEEAIAQVKNCPSYPAKETLTETYQLALKNLDCK